MEIPQEVLDHAVTLSTALLSARFASPDFAGEFEKRTLKNALEYAFRAGASWEHECATEGI